MKKPIKATCTILSVILLMTSLSSCSILFGNNNTDGGIVGEDTQYTIITIKNETADYTYQVKVGERPNIELPRISNCICVGAFSDPNGGTQYFDEDGDATMVWQSNFPSVFYARYENIIGMIHISELDWEEDPHYISFYKTYTFTYDLPKKFIKALESNSSLNVEITMHYDIIGETREDNYITSYLSSTKDSEGLIEQDNYVSTYSTFTTHTVTATCKGKQLLKNNCIYFKIGSRLGYEEARAKNFHCTLTIMEVK